ncbi:NAD(P)/FAD-dependent oxidoreductase [Halopiger goleimassiliensis]|uniref:NAD(P)/FAD-dependent oxidoreductase n=1 Tax=Halopiger goleimassiliensis TaxID=1293048 RepID=UPI00067812C7|nr:FAD-dependent oxidoreductase [Halopiger goleimassiliensis]
MVRIGAVGAGVATGAAAFALSETLPDANVTVLEASASVGGRAATERRGDVVYDYGANYLTSDDPRIEDLVTATLETDGLVDVTDPVWTFDAEGTVSEGRDADDHKWTFRGGLDRLASRLFTRTDAEMYPETRVETIVRNDRQDTWTLEDADGDRWGPFDAVLVSPPAPETASLLESADWDDRVRDHLVEAVTDVPFRTIWTGVFHYPFELERPYYALVNTDKNHEIGWIAREACKPGHVPAGESVLVVQANHEWSVERADDSPDDCLDELTALTADLLEDDRLGNPDWTDHHVWHHAIPEAGVATGPIETAADAGLHCLGDWVAGEGRLHAALRSGLEAGERIALG